jgi:hypothetical protein
MRYRDLDNLIQPTLDALGGVFVLRPWAGLPQRADDRVDYLSANKRTVAHGEPSGSGMLMCGQGRRPASRGGSGPPWVLSMRHRIVLVEELGRHFRPTADAEFVVDGLDVVADCVGR